MAATAGITISRARPFSRAKYGFVELDPAWFDPAGFSLNEDMARIFPGQAIVRRRRPRPLATHLRRPRAFRRHGDAYAAEATFAARETSA